GGIKVTITKRNHAHYQGAVEVYSQIYVTLDNIVIEDDSLPPSQGNGNGMPNPGETLELQIFMTNPSTIFAYGVRVSISSPDTLIQILEDEQYYGLIGPGQSVTSTEPFVLEISLAAEHGSEIIITLDAGDNLGLHYISQYILEITAPSPQFDNYNLPQAAVDSALYPGESSDMIITLMNTGGETSELTAVLHCETEGVTITDSTAVFPAAVAGEAFANNIDPFHLSVDTELYPGITAPLTMTIELADGWLDTLFFQLQIGPPQVNDPVVPVEGCWYYCFDNNDVGFNQAPSFQWIEIDPDSGGTGITLNLQDGQPNQSDSEILPLPAELNFQYCGQSFANITVGSDGWIACGETGFSDFRNRPLPAANEPDGMIAVFWDDLMLIDGGEVYYAYIDYLDCFVVEWSRLKHPQSSVLRQTFQLILWDAETYPTNTGDSPLKFQYYDVNDIGTQSNWSTTGLLSLTAENGLQYVYSTFYTPGAKVLTDGLALYFTTDPGSRIIPPILTYSPNSFRFELSSGQNETGVLILSNLGEAVLNYDLEIMPWQTEASGGPDNFGNIWIDSDEPGGMEFGWVNIGSIGVEIEFPHNDSTSADLPLGFSFPFYNRSFSTVIVSANGWLSFTSHSNAWNNTQLPSTSAPENLIAGWWDDLDPLTGDGRVLIWNNGSDSTVVSFLEVDHYGTSVQGTYTFQYILQREGRITLQYYEMEGNVSSATIGIQNQQKNDGLTIAHNNNYVHNLLRIDIVRPWLSLSPISGSMEENEIDTILVTASAANMYPTIYNTNIFLYSNDPEQQLVILPVEMEVTGQTLGGIADDLRIIRQEDGYLLKWLKREGYEYRIYSSSQAHFEPENAVLLGITEEDSFLDVSVNDQMRFYKVVAVMK
ncbi:MAG: hypothetical protein H8E87_03215, partial [FCB group bacterium]|nr:hypothetical protein [FCB group bacterium]